MAAEWSFRSEGDKIIATETWRLDDPELPFIVSPWHPNRARFERWISKASHVGTDYSLTGAEFAERFGADKLPKT